MAVEDLYNEVELLIRLRQGDERAFEQIYRAYSGPLTGKLMRLTKSPAYTVEILQEAFIRVWNNRETIAPEKGFRSYLFRIIENLAIDFFRKAAKDKRLMADIHLYQQTQAESIESALFERENYQVLHQIIDTLPPQRKAVFKLVKMEGKSYQEVGNLLGISPSTVSDHIVKATRYLRDQLSRHPDFTVVVLAGYSLLF